MRKKKKSFKNVKYVIVDEIHYFVESDRGTQLKFSFKSYTEYVDDPITMVGLSATVGNPKTSFRMVKPN